MPTPLAGKHKRGPYSRGFYSKEPRLRMVQILPVSPQREKTTLMSSLSRLMILLSPATTDSENKRVNFKWLSMKTLMFSLGFFGLGTAANIIAYMTGFTSELSMDNTKSIIDIGSQIASLAVMAATTAFPFLFASGIPSISKLALAKDMTSSKYGLVFILGSLLGFLSGNLGKCSTHTKPQPN